MGAEEAHQPGPVGRRGASKGGVRRMSLKSFLERGSTPARSNSHLRSRRQEKELAKRVSGHRISGSGSGHTKGDVRRKRVVRIEAKTTKYRSFGVTLDMVEKIENAAL